MTAESHNWITTAIPTCQGERHIAQAIRSIIGQCDAAGAPMVRELLICDDRSDDRTLDVIREECGDLARIVVNSERLGLAGNWNQCVAACRTHWIAVFHQDDEMLPGHLDRHTKIIETAYRKSPDFSGAPGMIVASTVMINAQGALLPSAQQPPEDGTGDRLYAPGEFLKALAEENPVRCSGVTLHTEAHKALGGFDPRWRYAVDWEFWARLSQHYAVHWCGPPATTAMRWHADSETQRLAKTLLDLEEVGLLLQQLQKYRSEQAPNKGVHALTRAYVCRAADAARSGRRGMGRTALRRAWKLNPGYVVRILWESPRTAGRLLTLTRP